MTLALYPGSFDPVTNGHLDIIQRAAGIFDRLIVGVVRNPAKAPLFSVEERTTMIEENIGHISNVEVVGFSGLLADYAHERGAHVLVKGLRAVSDFEAEFQQAHMNRALQPDLETVFLATDLAYAFLSSSIIKEVARLNGSVVGLVPEGVEKRLKEKFGVRSSGF